MPNVELRFYIIGDDNYPARTEYTAKASLANGHSFQGFGNTEEECLSDLKKNIGEFVDSMASRARAARQLLTK